MIFRRNHIFEIIILCFGTCLTGISKAGFGGGIGMFVLPLFTQMRSSRYAVALMLPLLFSTDVISLAHYWKQWHRTSILRLIPGAIIGIILASFVLIDISDYHLKKVIGAIVCLLTVIEFFRAQILQWIDPDKPDPDAVVQFKIWHGVIAGIVAGFFSTLAHMAGPIIIMYLLPQKLGNRKFVATTTILYFFINLTKIPVYFQLGYFTYVLLIETVLLLPFVALGVQIGVYLNSCFSEHTFSRIVLIVLFVTGIYLLLV